MVFAEKRLQRQPELQTCFKGPEATRFEESLANIVPHVKRGRLALAGSSALRHHLATRGLSHPNPTFNDLDVLIQEPNDILPTMKEDGRLLFTHFHPPADRPHMISAFFIKVLDVPTKTKVDFFSYPSFVQTEPAWFRGQEIQIPTPETLLLVSVLDTLKSLEFFKGAPTKRISTIDLTLQIADIEKAAEIWAAHFPDQKPLPATIEHIRQTFTEKPEIFVGKMLGHKPVAHCNECVDTQDFPIAPADDVREIMGIRRRGDHSSSEPDLKAEIARN